VGAGATHIHSIPHPQALSPAGGRLGASGGGYRSICSMRAARQKSPAPCLGGARLAVRGAIIPNCDHARKVGERLSSMEWQRAFRDYSQRALHSSEARLLQRAN